jgi:hypothetical protein
VVINDLHGGDLYVEGRARWRRSANGDQVGQAAGRAPEWGDGDVRR